jgi:adenosyl cobinamide kinase/adenosyl cobinamide phosphate guanylyltransferase
VITLVLGGARSGKSEVAERMATRLGDAVTFVATGSAVDAIGTDEEMDEEMAERIAFHRRRRPAGWTTVEVDDGLAGALCDLDGPVLVDALGTWLAGRAGFEVDAGELCRALSERRGDTVVVSDEVGLGVHPRSEAGRHFRDALGTLNQKVAQVADDVFLVMAGRVLPLERP